jgi:ribosome maturation factor RimP
MELEEQIKLAVKSCDVILYEISTTKEHSENIFRVTITAAGGISLDKCQEISKVISPLLDIHEPMRGKYRLEVSSPGIERKLKSLEHIQASIGELLKIKEYSTETFRGKLINVNNNTLILEDEEGDEVKIKYDDILSCATYYNWK